MTTLSGHTIHRLPVGSRWPNTYSVELRDPLGEIVCYGNGRSYEDAEFIARETTRKVYATSAMFDSFFDRVLGGKK